MDHLDASLVAQSVLKTYASLPKNGKPKARDGGKVEWTVLAGFCLCYPPVDRINEDETGNERWIVKCVALGTGTRVLPHCKLPKQGDILHDSHAEIIARRSLLLYFYAQLELAIQLGGGIGSEGSCFIRSQGEKAKWSLKEGVKLGMYVSTLPCGDASTYSLSLLAPPDSPTLPSSHYSTPCIPQTALAQSLGLNTSRHSPTSSDPALDPLVRRGRINYSSISSLRTKPGRLDSPPSTSHSCSDKMGNWNLLGIQGALLSAFLERIDLNLLVIGNVDYELRGRVKIEVERAIGGRLEGCEGVEVRLPEVMFCDDVFGNGREATLAVNGSEEALVSCSTSIAYTDSLGSQIIENGIKQGTSLRRIKGGPLSKNGSRSSKLALFVRYEALQSLCHPSSKVPVITYYAAKHQALTEPYQQCKDISRAPGAPYEGWLVSGREFESFTSDGIVQRVPEGAATDEF